MFRSKLSLCLGTTAMVIGSFVLVVSCNRKDKTTTTVTPTPTEDNGYANEHSLSEKSFDDAQTIADQANTVASGGNLGYKTTETTIGSCAVVTHSVTGDTTTVDFGTTNCMCTDGRNRRGKIIITKTGPYTATGSVKTIKFDNYFQNDNQVTGTKTITNMGLNSSSQPYFDVTVNGSVILASGAGTITSNWNRRRTWTAGSSTPTVWSDDEYTVSGTGTITRPSGAIITVNIPTATPLVIKYGCRWIEAGTITYTLPSGATRSINYGTTATCDNTAILTTPSGATYTITMP